MNGMKGRVVYRREKIGYCSIFKIKEESFKKEG